MYRMVVRPTLLYGAEWWLIKRAHIWRMRVAKMRMIRWICGHTRLDKIRNQVIRSTIGVASIEDTLREARFTLVCVYKKKEHGCTSETM